jgi:hypothetical protein
VNAVDQQGQGTGAAAAPPPGRTVVAEPRWWRALVWVGLPLLGAAAGWLLEAVAGWVAGLPLAPFHGLFKLVASVAEPHATVAALGIGALAGVVLAYLAALDRLAVTVADDRATLTRGGATRTLERPLVSTVFLDGKHLVLLGRDGGELAREASDLQGDELRDAFLAHGFPFRADGDPYEDRYRRWVDDLPDLPAGANALLRVRARALAKGDRDEAARLRADLARLGVVVRDDGRRQYWRRRGHPPDDATAGRRP